MTAQELLAALAAKLRSRAEWHTDGYYTTEAESLVNKATRDVLEGIAADINELLLPEPCRVCGSSIAVCDTLRNTPGSHSYSAHLKEET